MILSHEPRALLDSLARLNDEFGYFRVDLEILAERIRQKAPSKDIDRRVDEALGRWQLVDARARILTNALWRAAGAGDWSYAVLPELKGITLATAFRDKHQIADWTPPL